MVLRSRLALGAISIAAICFVTACGEGTGNTDNNTTSNNGGSGGRGGAGGAGGETGSTTTSHEGGSNTGGGNTTGCQNNQECENSPNGPVCNTNTGLCVTCIPVADPVVDCGVGSWCVPNTGKCDAGCTGDADCTTMSGALVCDLDKHACVGCLGDTNCPNGSICVNESCIAGCSPTHACQPGLTCCGQQCYDLAVDENNCGMCNDACEPVPNAEVLCTNGQCKQGNCNGSYADCDGDSTNGCETNSIVEGGCVCSPGAVQQCYLGAPGTMNNGPCKGGNQTCNAAGLGWGPCLGQILPITEICGNGIDDNCNGVLDDAPDTDQDGWPACEGDCNDNDPLINPGALEVTYKLVDNDNNPMTPPIVVPGGNGVDDDCDPATLDTVDPGPCGPTTTKLTGVTALDVANAMDLCQTAVLNAPLSQKKWGIISASYKLPSGADPTAAQLSIYQNSMAAIQVQYGYLGGNPANKNNIPKKNATMGMISTGNARYTGQTGFASPNGGTGLGIPNACPAAYIAANGGSLPSSQGGCSGNCFGGNTCNDGINLRLQIRVPTNAKSMSYDFKFYSGEFPEYVCTTFNDFYLALLTTTAMGIPPDKNVSFDSFGNAVSVNNGFFDVCQNTGLPPGAACFTCPKGVAELAGTGMEIVSGSNLVGGGTAWLTTDAPVVGGEIITLELVTFDVGDSAFDSLSLLDNFRWGLNTTGVGTHE